jgi:trk system potassium uptake protein TrkA
LTHVAQADSTDDDVLRQLGVPDFHRAVVGIGTDIEASVLTVLALTEIGVADITAKASSVKHGKILRAVGARHVIYPEASMGERVAHLITGKMLDFIEFDDGFAIAKVRAPREASGRSLADIGLRSRYGVTVVGVKLPGRDFEYARPETVVPSGCTLIVAGETAKVERFAANT